MSVNYTCVEFPYTGWAETNSLFLHANVFENRKLLSVHPVYQLLQYQPSTKLSQSALKAVPVCRRRNC